MRLAVVTLALLASFGCKRDPSRVDRDGDGVSSLTDCNDEDPLVLPGRSEVPYDGVDNDCDPNTPDDDLDGDGLGPPADCDDNDPDVRPGTVREVPYDGVDNDCDPLTLEDDLDGDGYGIAEDCNDTVAGINPGRAEVYYDGADNDCDPLNTPDDDQDRDGVPVEHDCDDENGLIRGPLLYHVDCDLDGFAADDVGAIFACALPAAPAECPDGSYTLEPPVAPDIDCTDEDADAFPGQTAWFDTLTTALPPGSTFDYDCSGVQERRNGLFSCQIVPGTIPNTTVCSFVEGFETDVACGVVGTFQTGCTDLGGGACAAVDEDFRVRQCH